MSSSCVIKVKELWSFGEQWDCSFVLKSNNKAVDGCFSGYPFTSKRLVSKSFCSEFFSSIINA